MGTIREYVQGRGAATTAYTFHYLYRNTALPDRRGRLTPASYLAGQLHGRMKKYIGAYVYRLRAALKTLEWAEAAVCVPSDRGGEAWVWRPELWAVIREYNPDTDWDKLLQTEIRVL